MKHMRTRVLYCLFLQVLLINAGYSSAAIKKLSFCNSVNLNYRFQLENLSTKEITDLSIVRSNDYYLLSIFKSDNPLSSQWQIVNSFFLIKAFKPTLFLDNDGPFHASTGFGDYSDHVPQLKINCYGDY